MYKRVKTGIDIWFNIHVRQQQLERGMLKKMQVKFTYLPFLEGI